MPLLQLGTAQLITKSGVDQNLPESFVGMVPEQTYRQIEMALQNGLRSFDSALIYRSQPAIGAVLGEWWRTGKLAHRRDVWITTKVFHPNATAMTFGITHMPDMHSFSPLEASVQTLEHFEKSLMQLGVGFVDMVLLHWPSGHLEGSVTENRQLRIAAWRVLEQVYNKGWARAIGVSNFSPDHLEQLKEDGATVVPMVNQVEASVTLQYPEIVKYCQDNGIVPQAYSPFGRGLAQLPKELHPLAAKYKKDLGQIAIKYLLQLGYAVVYLSNSPERMVTNHQLFDFDLTADEMALLNGLNRPDGGWGLPSPHTLY